MKYGYALSLLGGYFLRWLSEKYGESLVNIIAIHFGFIHISGMFLNFAPPPMIIFAGG